MRLRWGKGFILKGPEQNKLAFNKQFNTIHKLPFHCCHFLIYTYYWSMNLPDPATILGVCIYILQLFLFFFITFSCAGLELGQREQCQSSLSLFVCLLWLLLMHSDAFQLPPRCEEKDVDVLVHSS